MMKKRPVSQADQVLQNEDSATQKQLVLVRAEYKSGLVTSFPAASNLSSPGWLPNLVIWPLWTATAPLPLLPSDLPVPTRTWHLFFFLKGFLDSPIRFYPEQVYFF